MAATAHTGHILVPVDCAASEKLKRARSHLANLKRQATKLGRDTSRHSVLVDYDPDEGHYVVYAKTRPEPLPNLSLILGDVIVALSPVIGIVTGGAVNLGEVIVVIGGAAPPFLVLITGTSRAAPVLA